MFVRLSLKKYVERITALVFMLPISTCVPILLIFLNLRLRLRFWRGKGKGVRGGWRNGMLRCARESEEGPCCWCER